MTTYPFRPGDPAQPVNSSDPGVWLGGDLQSSAGAEASDDLTSRFVEPAPRPLHIVLGMHRSGTSLCASILHALGVDMADDPLVDRGNEHGHWERPEIVEVQDAILTSLGRGYFEGNHDFPLPAGWWRMPQMRPYISRLKALTLTASERSRDVGFKDPRTAKLLPLWTDICAQLNLKPKFVICLRNPVHVAQSLNARDGLDTIMGEFRWLDYTVDCFRYTANQAFHVVEYEKWFSEPRATLDGLRAFLNLDLDYRQEDVALAVDALIRPEANHAAETRQAAQIPVVRFFYHLAKQATMPNDLWQLHSFVEHFAQFRQLLLPFERKVLDVQGIADQHVQHIAALQGALDNTVIEKNQELDALRAQLESQSAHSAVELGALGETVTEKDREIEAFHHHIAAQSAQTATEIGALNETIAGKDHEIGALHHHIDAQSAQTATEIGTLNETIAGKDHEIEALHRHLDAQMAHWSAELRALSETATGRDGEIEALRAQLDAQSAHVEAGIGTLNESIAGKDGEIDALRAQLDAQSADAAAEIVTLNESVAKKHGEIDAFRVQIEAQSAHAEAQISTLNESVAAKDGEIEALRAQLGALSEEVAAKDRELVAFRAQLDDRSDVGRSPRRAGRLFGARRRG